MKKKLKKLYERTEFLHIRLTEKEKKRVTKEAERLGITVSEYCRKLIAGKKSKVEPSSKEIRAIVLCQDLVTYVQEKYGCEDDEELEERIKALWRVL